MGPGHWIMTVVCGATESLNARPGVYYLTLKKRLGFLRLAVQNGPSVRDAMGLETDIAVFVAVLAIMKMYKRKNSPFYLMMLFMKNK